MEWNEQQSCPAGTKKTASNSDTSSIRVTIMSSDSAEQQYKLQPTSDENQALLNNDDASDNEEQEEHESTTQVVEDEPPEDPRFHQPTPSPYKRALLLLFIGFMFWLAFNMRKSGWMGSQKPKVVHANRYSKEFKFRPAASPVITETLKDGRVRVRGAGPTSTATPTPTPTLKKSKRKSSSKSKGKRKAKAKKSATRPKARQ